MKINAMKHLIAICYFFWLAHCNGETNQIYVTIGDGKPLYFTKDGRTHSTSRPRNLEEMQESLPAKDFPEGNWGTTNNGIQMSIRFNKTLYTNGEPITATILARNVTTNRISYPVCTISGRDGPINFLVLTEKGEAMKTKEFFPAICSSSIAYLWLETQRKFVENVDGQFDLTNGTYIVCAVLPGFLVESGKVKIVVSK